MPVSKKNMTELATTSNQLRFSGRKASAVPVVFRIFFYEYFSNILGILSLVYRPNFVASSLLPPCLCVFLQRFCLTEISTTNILIENVKFGKLWPTI